MQKVGITNIKFKRLLLMTFNKSNAFSVYVFALMSEFRTLCTHVIKHGLFVVLRAVRTGIWKVSPIGRFKMITTFDERLS